MRFICRAVHLPTSIGGPLPGAVQVRLSFPSQIPSPSLPGWLEPAGFFLRLYTISAPTSPLVETACGSCFPPLFLGNAAPLSDRPNAERVSSLSSSLSGEAVRSMPAPESIHDDPVRQRAQSLLQHYDNDDFNADHLGYLDREAIDDGEFRSVPAALDARMERDRYSLLSMLLAGIYFGLLVGHYLFSTGSTEAILWWLVPVLLVSAYAVVTATNLLRRLQELSRIKALVEAAAARDPERT